MREDWKEVKLGEIAGLIKRGIAPKYVSENGYVVINQKCIRNGVLSFENSRLTSTSKRVSNEKFVKVGDVLINSTGTGTLGRTAPVKILNEKTTVDTHVTIFRGNEKVDKPFLGYLLNYHEPLITLLGKGATNQIELSAKDLEVTKVNIPKSKQTQRKIASILSAYDDLIENNLKRIKLLEEQAQLTYEEWFVRFKFPGHETTKFDEDTGLPEGWEKVKLVECANLIMGQSPKSEFYNNEEKGLPFHQGVKDYGFRFPTNSSWSTQGNRIAKENSILFSVRAPVGRLNVALEEIIIGRGLAAINHKKGWNSFLLYQLQNIFYEDNLMGCGAIYNSVTKKDVQEIEIISATKDINIKYNDFSSNVDKQIKNLTKQNQNLKEARDMLLPRLMSGMIDVDKLEVGSLKYEVNDSLGMVAEETSSFKK